MKTSYIFLFLLFPFLSVAQNTEKTTVEPDARLIEAYGADYINRLLNDNPFLIKRWNFYLDNAFFIEEASPDKKGDYQVIQVDDVNKVNILKIEKEQKLKRDWNTPTVYKIKNSNKLLVYHAGKTFNEKLQAHLKQ